MRARTGKPKQGGVPYQKLCTLPWSESEYIWLGKEHLVYDYNSRTGRFDAIALPGRIVVMTGHRRDLSTYIPGCVVVPDPLTWLKKLALRTRVRLAMPKVVRNYGYYQSVDR